MTLRRRNPKIRQKVANKRDRGKHHQGMETTTAKTPFHTLKTRLMLHNLNLQHILLSGSTLKRPALAAQARTLDKYILRFYFGVPLVKGFASRKMEILLFFLLPSNTFCFSGFSAVFLVTRRSPNDPPYTVVPFSLFSLSVIRKIDI